MRFGPFLGLAILLVIFWAGGFVFFHVAGFMIHLLLIFAVISLMVHLFTGSARTAGERPAALSIEVELVWRSCGC